MPDWVLIGADGMLGTELVRQLRRTEGYKVIPSTIRDLDITDLEAVREQGPPDYRVILSLDLNAITGEDLLFASEGGKLTRYDLRNDQVVWSGEWPVRIRRTPPVSGGAPAATLVPGP